MKYKIYKETTFFQKHKMKLVKIALTGTIIISLVPGCTNNYEETTYDTGTHQIVEIKRDLDFFGRDGKVGLTAPAGYKIKDYDYDFFQNQHLSFQDFLYENTTPVTVTNPNELGTPVENVENSESEIKEPSQHIIADTQRDISFWIGKQETKALHAPDGYEVMDYDYDKTENFEFETITYVNNDKVKVKDKNDYGTPVNPKPKNNSNIKSPGEHIVVQINRNFNPLLGKEEMKSLIAPPGYKVIDYDYDKNDTFEFETIVFENTIPVEVEDENELGTPLEPVIQQDNKTEFMPGEHILVQVERNIDLLFGDEGTKKLECPEGYEVIDYDYDKTNSFDFDTIMYVNKEKVEIEDIDKFGTPVNTKTL